MRNTMILSASLLLYLTVWVSAQLIGFEELHPGYETSEIVISDGYRGFNWSVDFLGMTSGYLPGSGYANGATGTMLAYTTYHRPVSMSTPDGALFDFISADLTAGRLDNEMVIVEGWRDGTIIYSDQVVTSTDGPHSFLFYFMGVDTVKIIPDQSDGMHHIAIDQIEVSGAVPEPTTLILLAIGVMFLSKKQAGKLS